MTFIIPPVTSLPAAQPSSAAQGIAQAHQAPTAVQAAAAVTANPVRTETRMAATASGNSGASDKAKGERGRKTDANADATEAKTDRAHARPRGMGNKADLSV